MKRSEFSSYQGVADILDRKEDFIRTISEEKTNPLPANIMTGCIYWETDDVDEWVESIGEDDVEDWEEEGEWGEDGEWYPYEPEWDDSAAPA